MALAQSAPRERCPNKGNHLQGWLLVAGFRIPELGHDEEIHFLGCQGNCWCSGGGEETLSHTKQPPGCENGLNRLIVMVAGNFLRVFLRAGIVYSCPGKGIGTKTNSSFMDQREEGPFTALPWRFRWSWMISGDTGQLQPKPHHFMECCLPQEHLS